VGTPLAAVDFQEGTDLHAGNGLVVMMALTALPGRARCHHGPIADGKLLQK